MSVKRLVVIALAVFAVLNLLVLIPWIIGHDGGGGEPGGGTDDRSSGDVFS
jgi:hypothetical protein